jgi:hypothetical protein
MTLALVFFRIFFLVFVVKRFMFVAPTIAEEVKKEWLLSGNKLIADTTYARNLVFSASVRLPFQTEQYLISNTVFCWGRNRHLESLEHLEGTLGTLHPHCTVDGFHR